MMTCRSRLRGKRSSIRRSLTAVGRSGSCLSSALLTLTASHTPWILSSSFTFPSQKKVQPPFSSSMETSLASLVSLIAAMSIRYIRAVADLPGEYPLRILQQVRVECQVGTKVVRATLYRVWQAICTEVLYLP